MRKAFWVLVCISVLTACSSNKPLGKSASKKQLSEKESVAFGKYFIDGLKQKVLGNYDQAEEFYSKAFAIDPNSAAVHYEFGLVYNFQKDFQKAFESFEMASKLDPNNYWYKLSYASFLESNGQKEKAIEVFTELTDQNPKQVELKYELSKLLVGVGKYDEGIAVLNEIEEKIGITEDISFLKQKIYLHQNDVDNALNEINKLIDFNPMEVRYYGVLSDIYMSNKLEEKALPVLQKMKELDPESYLVNFSLAEYYRSQGKQVEFVEELKTAFENPKMNIDEKIKYVLTYYQVDSRDKAKKAEGISLCESITKGHPNNAKSYAIYADFLYFDDQVEKSKTAYMKTVELDSSRFPVWNQMMVIFSETNDFENLVKYGSRAIELFPNQPTAYLLYGIGLSQQKQYKFAIDSYEMGKDVVVENNALKAQFYSSLGDSYNELKNFNKSDLNFEEALKLDPNNVYVLNNYSYYLSLRGDHLERAKEMSAQSNNIAPNQSSFQDTYAWILFQLKEYEEANFWIDKALSSDGKSAVLLEHKGDILFFLNRQAEAIEYWKKAKQGLGASELIDKKISEGKWFE